MIYQDKRISSVFTRPHLPFLICIVVFGIIYFSFSYNVIFYAPDEGATAYHFQKTLQGGVQHRDFYSVYGVGYYIFGAWLFKIFGARLIVLRLFVVALKLFMAALIYMVSVRLMRPTFAFFSSIGFILWWGDPFLAATQLLYPSHISQALGLLSVLLALVYMESRRKLYAFLAALAVGLSALFKPTAALFNLLALFLFFFAREMLLDLAASRTAEGKQFHDQKALLANGWILLLIIISISGVSTLFVLLSRFGADFAHFGFFLLPASLITFFLLVLSIKRIQTIDSGKVFWKNCKETFFLYVLLGSGMLLWQAFQAVYFLQKGAFSEYLGTYSTASAYYGNFGIQMLNGPLIIYLSLLALGIMWGLWVLFQKIARKNGSLRILLVIVVAGLAVTIPFFWFLWSNIPHTFHITLSNTALCFCLLALLSLIFKDSVSAIREKNLNGLLGALLIATYAAMTVMDAYPRADTGHISMIFPPFLILFGMLGQRFYDTFTALCKPLLPKKAALCAGTTTTVFGVGIFLPSVFMLFMLYILVMPSREQGLQLYGGKLTLAPRYAPAVERAKGIVLHMSRDYSWAPLSQPTAGYLFEAAERIGQITRPGDRVFCPMNSALMLYFLSNREGISGKADCYVWQTVTGYASADIFKDFSDIDLTRLIAETKPKAIVVEENAKETKRFTRNWPTTWSFIQNNYRYAESIGQYQIYLPS